MPTTERVHALGVAELHPAAAPMQDVAANRRAILAERARGEGVVAHPPFWYSVHLNEPCNQRCIMCVPTGNHGDANLAFERFEALFDQIKSHAEHITLIGGETLMYPRIGEVLELLAQHPIGVTINTNATMLDEQITAQLLALHRLELKCSIDAASADTYLRIRGRNHFGRVTQRLLDFAERSAGHGNVSIIPVFVVMRENLEEVVPFLEFAELLDPERVEFHPVRHVESWSTENATGWHFDGSAQVCESFPEAFNAVMARAAAVGEHKGIEIEIHRL